MDDECDVHEITLFDDPLLGLCSQPQEEDDVKYDFVENKTPVVEKKSKRSSSSAGAKKPLSANSSSKNNMKTPERSGRSSSRKKALWSVEKSIKKSSRSEMSPWDKAIAKSPSLAKYVQDTVKAQKKIDRFKLKVVEVDPYTVN